MKKRSKILIGVMSLALLGGVGSALALTRNAKTVSSTSPAFDKAIYLYWDTESETSATIGSVGQDIDHVEVNVPVYKYLTVSPKSSKSVAGTVTVRFALAPSTGCVVTGLSVSVYETASLADDSSVASLIDGVTPSVVNGEGYVEKTITITATTETTSAVHQTQAFYALKVNYDGTAAPGSTLGGLVTISQTFAAAV